MPVRKPVTGAKPLIRKRPMLTKDEGVTPSIPKQAPVKRVKPKPRAAARSSGVKKTGTATRNLANQAKGLDAKLYAFDQRVKGMSYRAIAEDMREAGIADVSHQTVKNWVDEECEARIEPVGKNLIAMETARLERYLRALEQRIELGDDKAIAVAIRASESYRKLLGMDAPTQQNINLGADVPDFNLLNKVEQFAREQAAKEAALKAGAETSEENSGESK